MTIDAFDHYTVRANDIEAARRFYGEILGLRVEPRPGATIPAFLVFVGDQAMVHLFQASDEMQSVFGRMQPSDEEEAQWRTGRMHHVAFHAVGLADMRSRLQSAGIDFTERSLTAQDKHLLVLKDPDGVELEIQFAMGEVATSN